MLLNFMYTHIYIYIYIYPPILPPSFSRRTNPTPSAGSLPECVGAPIMATGVGTWSLQATLTQGLIYD